MTSTDSLDDTITELQVLWPALPQALPRDAGTQASERVSTSENVHTIPLNPDVAATIHNLSYAIPQWTGWAAMSADLASKTTDIPACLRRIPGYHHRLLELGRTRDAQRLADAATAWLSACRRALGLNRPDRPIGEHCPRHDTPLTPLVQPGDHGHLRYERLDSNNRPVNPNIAWQRTDVIQCRHCNAVWTPDRYMLLGRLIRQANRDRQPTTDTGDAA